MEKCEVFAESSDFYQYVERAGQSINLFEAKLNESEVNPIHPRFDRK